ncbi:MAG TPA: nitrous oxide reductase family maturation protein NosD [Bacteroidales bacterium]|nr:nitrous oxide reductase family maturation protein NosD [Bacteroidales bacterium]
MTAWVPLKCFSQGKKFGLLLPVEEQLPQTKPIPLQPLLDKALPGDTLILDRAIYMGPVHITTDRLVINGQGLAIITGMDLESVIHLECDSTKIMNLTITNSGGSHDRIDSGVKIYGNYNVIENCRIKECLFGVDIFKSDHNLVFHCEISSLTRRSKALKGDGVRLWWAKYNTVMGNYWHDVRDMVVWYSEENLFMDNKGIGNRYSIHFMYAHNNRIQGNEFYENSVGVFLMYSERTIMIDNLIMNSQGESGMCLGLKETSSNQILNNRFIYSAEGIHFDVSPYEIDKINTISQNEIAFCRAGMFFHTNQEGNLIKQNYFHNNLAQVVAEGKTASMNIWENNYFDDYMGFDRDKDNIGDNPYELYTYVEHLWDFNTDVKFYYGAPILAVLDFLERLAPFSKPKFILRDKKPMFKYQPSEVSY